MACLADASIVAVGDTARASRERVERLNDVLKTDAGTPIKSGSNVSPI